VSFSALVSRYARDIPPGAMRATLQKAGVLSEDSAGRLSVSQKFFYSRQVDEDFIRGLGFSLSNLGSTLCTTLRFINEPISRTSENESSAASSA
jgi:hypothetical protein